MEKDLTSGLHKIVGLKRIGIFGGTFDPIHLGHLVCAEQVREGIGLDSVIFVPCAIPPHKPDYVPAEAEHRLRMVELAIENTETFVCSDIEIRRGGISYTVDTIAELRKRVGREAELWLILGLDAYLEIGTWKQPERIAAECLLAVARRPGYRPDMASLKGFESRTRFIEITEIGVSSTAVRKRIAQGKSIRFLVPRSVEAYIRQKGLYGSA